MFDLHVAEPSDTPEASPVATRKLKAHFRRSIRRLPMPKMNVDESRTFGVGVALKTRVRSLSAGKGACHENLGILLNDSHLKGSHR